MTRPDFPFVAPLDSDKESVKFPCGVREHPPGNAGDFLGAEPSLERQQDDHAVTGGEVRFLLGESEEGTELGVRECLCLMLRVPLS